MLIISWPEPRSPPLLELPSGLHPDTSLDLSPDRQGWKGPQRPPTTDHRGTPSWVEGEPETCPLRSRRLAQGRRASESGWPASGAQASTHSGAAFTPSCPLPGVAEGCNPPWLQRDGRPHVEGWATRRPLRFFERQTAPHGVAPWAQLCGGSPDAWKEPTSGGHFWPLLLAGSAGVQWGRLGAVRTPQSGQPCPRGVWL